MKRSTLMAATLLATHSLLHGAAQAQPVTGLYVGGAGGANFLQQERIKSVLAGGVNVPSQVRTGFQTGVAGLGSLGYGFGNGVRLELEGNYRTNRPDSFPGAAPGIRSVGGREQKYGPMANVLFDLDVGSPYIFPYIGAGAGYAWVDRRVRVASADGTLNTQGGTDSSFAYQAIAGLSFPVPPVVGLSLTAEYRYYALTGEREFDRTVSAVGASSTGKVRTTENYNHTLLLGLRYAFNVVPPPPPPSPVPVAAPVQQEARSYLVFFDWDRASLTERARQVVAEAAQATTRVQVTRIEVAGHTDRSGPDSYNMRLSVRRAQAVAAELVRLGVPRGSITTQGFGERNPIVRTADGVREPQNRRVEIVLR
jgi:OmpA-OmpF porin, OOP family